MSKTLPFVWFGSKTNSVDFITDKLISTDTYVEPFGGAGVILLNREPRRVEVYNDLDGRITAFFEALREHPDELQKALSLTPYSRREFERAVNTDLSDSDLDVIERARLFLVLTEQSRYGRGLDCSESDWGYNVTPVEGDVKTNVNKSVSAWWSKVDGLGEVADRMREVQIENKPATDIIERYDTEEALFYLDPPYVHETRGSTDSYGDYEMTDDDHRDLADQLDRIDGYAAISGYDTDLYRELFSDWYRHTAEEKTQAVHTESGVKTKTNQEVLWTNYDPEEHRDMNDWRRSDGQGSLDLYAVNGNRD